MKPSTFHLELGRQMADDDLDVYAALVAVVLRGDPKTRERMRHAFPELVAAVEASER